MRHKLPTMTKRAVAMFLLIAGSLICAGSAFAQSQATAADLSGTVTDPNGAVVTGAMVMAREFGDRHFKIGDER